MARRSTTLNFAERSAKFVSRSIEDAFELVVSFLDSFVAAVTAAGRRNVH
jgi:hypothetical protein